GSVTDPALCAEAVRGVDCVFHQAALPSVQRSVADPRPSHDANATGTLNLLIAAEDAGVRRFVYAASSSAYGDTE
ncbi:MAG: NAD-dependent epimerase/dehydratase family protein, partial [Gemmatimonadetes bacterium]|nr:NAD-dependent epimerase/dehydratase family protein [Gemmatimonadota bacterium]NIR80345.1 NAD-dependent epimerase/dehydratase family protein [Gemmatimonadota bacterium]NIT89108.1 NAD-dependent epimerase/dehydratase family protein [Gemmatimonadota bacterium]NIU32905.1 NAD-dependent epimerase/dehydratase family protein [Gemmatimonadota bacterium]NIU37304.1 NAD-dependent epimerase/dehydratase family protein [Gemmatimonadota bacterium]